MARRAASRAKRPATRRSAQTAVARYRAKMRRQGMKLVQFWAPDVAAPGFAEECRRQSRLASRDARHERQVLEEIEALSAGLDLGSVPEFVWPPGRQGP